MRIKIDESYDDFRQLRENGFYFADKTLILKEYLYDHFKSRILFARPRRFGKTLTMTMFREFLDIRQDSRDIFDGLMIMEHAEIVEQYMNQYPVVFLPLKEVFGESFEEVFRNFQIAISKVCEANLFLLDSNSVSSAGKQFFEKLWHQNADRANTVQALDLLCQMLKQHYHKPAFVIIDEYDVPMAKTVDMPFYENVRDMISHMLSYVCKTNGNVKSVMLSGCLFTVKNSAYSGVNNIVPYTVLNPVYASSIGFTDENVKKLLEDAGLSDHYDTVAKWYDGYIFGRDKMYCPWDVLKYVNSVLEGSYSAAMGPESYWANTSETSQDIIHGFLGRISDVEEGFEQLIAGKAIICTVNDKLPYHRIHENGENLWSALVETGYLTKDVKERMPRMPLRIPNQSINEVFRQEVWDFFKARINNDFVNGLENALWAGDIEKAEATLNLILENTLSFYHEYHEYSYHLILAGFFTGLGYRVLSEVESGYGRSDLVILDPSAKRGMILELKHEKEEKNMGEALDEAESQIVKEKYESRLIYEGYTTRLKYAMVFCDKNAMIRMV